MGTYALVTAPTVEPVTTAEAKLHLRVDIDADDALIAALIQAAREQVEAVTDRALITQTWAWHADAFPQTDTLELLLPPLQSVTSITYTDADGDVHTFASSNYQVDTASAPGRIVLVSGASWPADTLRAANGVTVTFVAGYGDAGSAVPASLRAAMKLLVGHWYEHREQVVLGTGAREVPMGATMLMWPYRVVTF